MCHVEHAPARATIPAAGFLVIHGGVQERRIIHYSGCVQGVGFRWTVLRHLEGMPLSGFVRNLPDGRVELLIEGDPRQLDEAATRVRRALGAYITAEEQQTAPATGEFQGFRIAR